MEINNKDIKTHMWHHPVMIGKHVCTYKELEIKFKTQHFVHYDQRSKAFSIGPFISNMVHKSVAMFIIEMMCL